MGRLALLVGEIAAGPRMLKGSWLLRHGCGDGQRHKDEVGLPPPGYHMSICKSESGGNICDH